MPSSFDTRFSTTAAPRTLDLSGESVRLVDGNGVERTITAAVDRLPTRIEQRSSHRLRVESVSVLALESTSTGLGGVTDGWGLKLGEETTGYDFIDQTDADGGMLDMLFERVTILDTGVPQPADI